MIGKFLIESLTGTMLTRSAASTRLIADLTYSQYMCCVSGEARIECWIELPCSQVTNMSNTYLLTLNQFAEMIRRKLGRRLWVAVHTNSESW